MAHGQPVPEPTLSPAPADAPGEVHPAGTWAELEWVVLPARERTASLPEDTRAHDFKARVRGLLASPGRIGERAAVTTLIGRRVEGTLRAVRPRNPVDFGDPSPELLAAGVSARRRLDGRGP
jgi:hypothetical protein